jgi:hypothetical protein
MNELLSCKEILKMHYRSHRKEEKGAPILIKVQSNFKIGPKFYDISAYESSLLYNIKSEIAEKAHLKPENVYQLIR